MVIELSGRTDVTVIEIPTAYVSWVTGGRGLTLKDIEKQTATLCFVDRNSGDVDGTLPPSHLLYITHVFKP